LSFESQAKRDAFLAQARQCDIFAGIPLEKIEQHIEARHLLVSTTEMIEAGDIQDYIAALEVAS